MRKTFYDPHNQKHKLAPATGEPFRVVSTIDTTVVEQNVEMREKLSRNRVVAALPMGDLIRRKVVGDEKHKIQYERAAEKMTAKSEDSSLGNVAYVIDWLVNHWNEDRKWKFKMRWYGLSSTNDTLEPIDGLTRSSVMRYLEKKLKDGRAPSDVLHQFIVG